MHGDVLVAVATLLACIVALFGNWIQARLFSPKLSLRIVKPFGTAVPINLHDPSTDTSRWEDARWYNLCVENSVPWPNATRVQVFLIRVEAFGPDNTPQVKWSGYVPMRWVHQELYPLARTVGQAAECDMLCVVKKKYVDLVPMIHPSNLQTRYREKMDIILHFEARSDEGNSPMFAVRVSWDGEWADGETEMANHLIVQPYVPPSATSRLAFAIDSSAKGSP